MFGQGEAAISSSFTSSRTGLTVNAKLVVYEIEDGEDGIGGDGGRERG